MEIPNGVECWSNGAETILGFIIEHGIKIRSRLYGVGSAWDAKCSCFYMLSGPAAPDRQECMEWGIKNAFFISKVFKYSDDPEGASEYHLQITDKFYYAYVLPKIIKEKPDNWMSILIQDTVKRGEVTCR